MGLSGVVVDSMGELLFGELEPPMTKTVKQEKGRAIWLIDV
jgi:hypothetical protein